MGNSIIEAQLDEKDYKEHYTLTINVGDRVALPVFPCTEPLSPNHWLRYIELGNRCWQEAIPVRRSNLNWNNEST